MTEGGESGDDGDKASRMTEGGVEDDRRGIGMKIANDNSKLSFLLFLLSFLRKQESSLGCCGV